MFDYDEEKEWLEKSKNRLHFLKLLMAVGILLGLVCIAAITLKVLNII